MTTPRHDWTTDEALDLIATPFHDLLAEANRVHRQRFDPHVVEAAMLLSVKTGACPEDCAYCPQSAKWNTELEPARLMPTDEIVAAADKARRHRARRGSAWGRRGARPTIGRSPRSPTRSGPSEPEAWRPA